MNKTEKTIKQAASPAFTGRLKRYSQLYTLSILVRYLWPDKRMDLKVRVILAAACLVLAKVVNLYVPFLYKMSIDALSGEAALVALPVGIIIAYGVARGLHQGFGELRDIIFIKVSQHAQRAIALQTFKHLHNLSLSFHLDRQTGGLSRVIERGTQGINFVLNFMAFNILPTILEIGMVTVVLLLKFNYQFAIVILVTVSVYILFTLRYTEWRLKYRRAMNTLDSEANTKAIDSLLNFETVKYFNNESHEYRRYDTALAGYERAAIKNMLTLGTLNIGQAFIIGAGLVVIMLMAGNGVIRGEYTIGDFVLVNTFLIQLFLPLNFLGFVYRQIRQSLTDMDKMFELLKVESPIRDRPDAVELPAGRGEVVFKNVSFRYDGIRPVLSDISFKIPAGKTTAIVGASGEGKSTISRLLFRFYDVEEGAIKIDNQDIRSVSLASLRSNIGVVPQDTVLFNDTIYYNIQYGRPEATAAEITRAAELAKIDAFIRSLPDKYQSRVGERGLKLSGGEKQRIAVARTILKNPGILIFDEATSALDSQTENEMQRSLKAVFKNKTTLAIAHRLSTIIDADEILVLQKGRIVERGSHEVLLAEKGVYFEMWQRQQEAEEARQKLGHLLTP